MKYVIRLKPLSPFFFGGETTFGDNVTQNYFVRSELLPQQATLLGLMRYVVLKINNRLVTPGENPSPEDINARIALIGKESFSISSGIVQDFGVIKSLSPVFVSDEDGNVLMPCVTDAGYQVTFDPAIPVWGNTGGEKPMPVVVRSDGSDFSCKDYDNYLYWIENGGRRVEFDKVFADAEQIGIKKGASENDAKGFFKQTMKTFVSDFHDYAFSFSAEIDDDRLAYLTAGTRFTDIVSMGGNRSMFFMSISRVSDCHPEPLSCFRHPLFLSTDGCDGKPARFVLMADTYLSQEEWASLDFVWGESVPNRYIKSETGRLHRGKPDKTSLYRLLTRGSVIYHHDPRHVAAILDNPRLTSVGLNKIIY